VIHHLNFRGRTAHIQEGVHSIIIFTQQIIKLQLRYLSVSLFRFFVHFPFFNLLIFIILQLFKLSLDLLYLPMVINYVDRVKLTAENPRKFFNKAHYSETRMGTNGIVPF
jgi:hypothetical protein